MTRSFAMCLQFVPGACSTANVQSHQMLLNGGRSWMLSACLHLRSENTIKPSTVFLTFPVRRSRPTEHGGWDCPLLTLLLRLNAHLMWFTRYWQNFDIQHFSLAT